MRPYVFLFVLAGCGERFVPEPIDNMTPPDRSIGDLAGLPGELCDDAGFEIAVTGAPGLAAFCIDRFEASVDAGDLGNPQQSSNASTGVDGSTLASAQQALGATVATNISWFQAKSACSNAGKRLCTAAEWTAACRGPESHAFPYGNTFDAEACNGFSSRGLGMVEATGNRDTCGGALGAYDLSGNVSEWTEDLVLRNGMGLRFALGGHARSNQVGLACAQDEALIAPDTQSDRVGFRCCRTP